MRFISNKYFIYEKQFVFVLGSGDRRTGLLTPASARWNMLQSPTVSEQRPKLSAICWGGKGIKVLQSPKEVHTQITIQEVTW